MDRTTSYMLYIRAGVADADGANPSTLAPPTTSIGCLTVWFALVLGGLATDLRIVECAWETSSPSGSLPCLERVRGDARTLVAVGQRDGRVGASDGGSNGRAERSDRGVGQCLRGHDDMESATRILDALFGDVSGGHGALDIALRALILNDVLPGVSASLWSDAACFDVLRSRVYGGKLPWPLRGWLSRGARRAALSDLGTSGTSGTVDASRSVGRAVHALDALCASFAADHIEEKMSVRTRSLLAAVCTTIRTFPVCEAIRAPARGLDEWADGVLRDVVVNGKQVRGVPAALSDSRWAGVRAVGGWHGAGDGAHGGIFGDDDGAFDGGDEHHKGEHHEDAGTSGMDRTSTYWLVGIGALATLYAAMLLRESVDIELVDAEL